MFKEINECVKSIDEPVDLIIGGDHNQEISSIEVQHFFLNFNYKMCIKPLMGCI